MGTAREYRKDIVMTFEEVRTLNKAIIIYGKVSQIDKAIEEMSELTKALLKKRYNAGSTDDITEEMADVLIMISQLMLIYDNAEVVEKQMEHKIKRLEHKLLQKNE